MSDPGAIQKKKNTYRVLAVCGLILILASVLLLLSLQAEPQKNQLMEKPAATFFQPPLEGNE